MEVAAAVRSVLRFCVRLAVGLVLLQAVFLGLLVAAQAVPNQPVIDHLGEAVDSGDYGAPYGPDGFGGVADRFTECVVLGYGVSSADDDRSAFTRAVGGPRLASCEDGVAQVRELAAGTSYITELSYFRYWSGYSVLTRPVLALTDVPGLRLVVGGVFAAAALAAFLALSRRAGTAAAFALFVPIAAGTNAIAMPSTAFSHGIALAAVAAGVALVSVTARGGWRGAALGAAGAGALFCYVDLLTVPSMSWALCAAAAGAVAHAYRGSLLVTFRTVLAAGVAWPVAFGVTWVARWLIAAAFMGTSVFTKVSDVSRYRLDGGDTSKAFGAGVSANWNWWLEHSATAVPLLIAAGIVVLLGIGLTLVRHGVPALVSTLVLAAPALVVPLWYCVLSNHSQIHAFFTYRSIPAAVGIVAMAAVVTARRTPVLAADRERAVRA